MKNKTKLIISISMIILGMGLTCLSYSFQESIFWGVIFSLGISILTAAIIDIYEYIINYSKKASLMESMGVIDVGYNKSSDSQTDIYNDAKRLRIIFNAGASTFRTYQNAIVESIIKNNCQVQIILSGKEILKSDGYMSVENEADISKEIVEKIIDEISRESHHGSIELKYSSIAPVGSLEIKDNKYCVFVPYLYKRHSAVCYHTRYKNTGKKDDIYHQWEKHFENIWDKGKLILKYPQTTEDVFDCTES